MRICCLICSGTNGKGGLERAVGAVGRGLRDAGHDFSLALLHGTSDPNWHEGIPTAAACFPKSTRELSRVAPAAVRWVGQALRLAAPDVLLVTEPRAAVLARAARPLNCPPMLSWVHNGVTLKNHPGLLRLCRAHLLVSEGMRLHVRGRPAFVVGNPVESGVMPVPRPAAGASFLYLGRLVTGKRVDRILSALRRAPRARLDVLGDGPEMGELQQLAGRLGVAERVTWHGWLTAPWQAVKEASALLLTSDSEGSPLVLLEAAARRVPLVAMDCDYGPRDIITPNNGWLVPLGDDSALAGVLERIADHTLPLPSADEVRATMVRFSLERTLLRVEQALVEAVNRPSRTRQSPIRAL